MTPPDPRPGQPYLDRLLAQHLAQLFGTLAPATDHFLRAHLGEVELAGLGERAGGGAEAGDRFGGRRVRDVRNQRIEARPSLGLEDAGHRDRVPGVGGEPIDRLGRQQHQFARAKRRGGRIDITC